MDLDLDLLGLPARPLARLEGRAQPVEVLLLHGRLGRIRIQLDAGRVDDVGRARGPVAGLDPAVEERAEPGLPIRALGHGAAQARGDARGVAHEVLEARRRDARGQVDELGVTCAGVALGEEQVDVAGPHGLRARVRVGDGIGGGAHAGLAGAERRQRPGDARGSGLERVLLQLGRLGQRVRRDEAHLLDLAQERPGTPRLLLRRPERAAQQQVGPRARDRDVREPPLLGGVALLELLAERLHRLGELLLRLRAAPRQRRQLGGVAAEC